MGLLLDKMGFPRASQRLLFDNDEACLLDLGGFAKEKHYSPSFHLVMEALIMLVNKAIEVGTLKGFLISNSQS